jgi:hypothetical protein
MVYHPQLKYAGRLDIRGIWNDRTWLIDLKSGAVPKTTALQTAAYREACDVKPERRAALQLSETRYNLIKYSNPADLSFFISALNCYHYIHKDP